MQRSLECYQYDTWVLSADCQYRVISNRVLLLSMRTYTLTRLYYITLAILQCQLPWISKNAILLVFPDSRILSAFHHFTIMVIWSWLAFIWSDSFRWIMVLILDDGVFCCAGAGARGVAAAIALNCCSVWYWSLAEANNNERQQLASSLHPCIREPSIGLIGLVQERGGGRRDQRTIILQTHARS